MALDICLGCHIESIAIAKFIPAWVVRVVAGAHGVDIHLLHAAYILLHAFNRYHISSVGVKLVAVGTFDKHGLTVYEQLCVFDFDTAETYIHRYYLFNFSVFQKSGTEGVEVRCFGSPFVRVGNVERAGHFPLGVGDGGVGYHLVAVKKLQLQCA